MRSFVDIKIMNIDNLKTLYLKIEVYEISFFLIIIIIHAFVFAHKIKEGQVIKGGNLRIRGAGKGID